MFVPAAVASKTSRVEQPQQAEAGSGTRRKTARFDSEVRSGATSDLPPSAAVDAKFFGSDVRLKPALLGSFGELPVAAAASSARASSLPGPSRRGQSRGPSRHSCYHG